MLVGTQSWWELKPGLFRVRTQGHTRRQAGFSGGCFLPVKWEVPDSEVWAYWGTFKERGEPRAMEMQ